jgi:hypothetical protein
VGIERREHLVQRRDGGVAKRRCLSAGDVHPRNRQPDLILSPPARSKIAVEQRAANNGGNSGKVFPFLFPFMLFPVAYERESLCLSANEAGERIELSILPRRPRSCRGRHRARRDRPES